MKNIILIGYRGTGKSKIGKLLAKTLGKKFVDSDDEISLHESKPIREIFKEKGEDYFRKVEEEVIEELCKQEGIVLSCGGGVPTRAKNLENIKKNSIVFLLTASPEKILSRIGEDKDRPRLTNEKTELGEIKKMLELRKAFYEKAADYVIDSEHNDEQKKVKEIIEILNKEQVIK
ncbi:MAG: shikimate kinase [Candidatus Diapherotrites archaeon]|nr:shikimate kinase [Candidatus Diapherotrites archaeon]